MTTSYPDAIKRLTALQRTQWRDRPPSELAREELGFRERFEQLHDMCFKADNPWRVIAGGHNLLYWLRTRYTINKDPDPQDLDDEFPFLLEAGE